MEPWLTPTHPDLTHSPRAPLSAFGPGREPPLAGSLPQRFSDPLAGLSEPASTPRGPCRLASPGMASSEHTSAPVPTAT